jgi:endogenous inhibitor of DNA gyrase (YacG/DUF329 family)
MTKDPVTPLTAGQRRCPICNKPVTPRHQPFCSQRCADIDLGRWLNGEYRIPGNPDPDIFGDEN